MKKEENRSSIGNMEAKVICLIGYLGAIILLWMGGLAFFSWALPLGIYILETKNEYVKKKKLRQLYLLGCNFIENILFYTL